MQTTSEYAKANPDLVRRIQRSFGDIAHFIKEKPEDARLALAKGYSSLSKEELDLAFNQLLYAEFEGFLDLSQANNVRFAADHGFDGQLSKEVRLARAPPTMNTFVARWPQQRLKYRRRLNYQT